MGLRLRQTKHISVISLHVNIDISDSAVYIDHLKLSNRNKCRKKSLKIPKG